MVQPPRVNSDNGLPQRWLTTVTSSYDKNLHPQISQRVGFSPQITGYFQYFMHNIATIYQHQLNKFESLTLVSMRAVYPENFHQIGSVQKKWQAFFFFHEEYNIATIYQHHLNKFESLTLVSMRAVYPENFHPIGSVQKNGRRFSLFMRKILEQIQPQKNNTCAPYIQHIFYQILGNPPFFAIQLRFFGLNRLENLKWPICG